MKYLLTIILLSLPIFSQQQNISQCGLGAVDSQLGPGNYTNGFPCPCGINSPPGNGGINVVLQGPLGGNYWVWIVPTLPIPSYGILCPGYVIDIDYITSTPILWLSGTFNSPTSVCSGNICNKTTTIPYFAGNTWNFTMQAIITRSSVPCGYCSTAAIHLWR